MEIDPNRRWALKALIQHLDSHNTRAMLYVLATKLRDGSVQDPPPQVIRDSVNMLNREVLSFLHQLLDEEFPPIGG